MGAAVVAVAVVVPVPTHLPSSVVVVAGEAVPRQAFQQVVAAKHPLAVAPVSPVAVALIRWRVRVAELGWLRSQDQHLVRPHLVTEQSAVQVCMDLGVVAVVDSEIQTATDAALPVGGTVVPMQAAALMDRRIPVVVGAVGAVLRKLVEMAAPASAS